MLRLPLRLLALAATATLLTACSTMPDWTKPSGWIDTVAGGEQKVSPEEKTAPPPPSAGDKPVVPQQTAAAPSQENVPVDNPLEDKPAEPRIKPTDENTEFPVLAAQPDAQTADTTDAQRREIRDSLVADRDRAQHSADELRGGTEKPAAPPPPAAAKPADAPATAATTTPPATGGN